MKRSQLLKLYNENSNKELASMLDISEPTLIRHLRNFGIPLKGSGRRTEKLKLKKDKK